MNSRLLQFLQAENISQSQFADSIGVARASVSHILAGRNKPGFDFIESMARRYPSLNVDWLVTGRGKMYKSTSESTTESPARPIMTEAQAPELEPLPYSEPMDGLFADTVVDSPAHIESKTIVKKQQLSIKQKNIIKIVVFYDDNTYQELR